MLESFSSKTFAVDVLDWIFPSIILIVLGTFVTWAQPLKISPGPKIDIEFFFRLT